MNSKTTVINLLAGPGCGKSTNAALLFGLLKQAGVNAELVSEFAKDLVWEGRSAALAFQPYVTAKQMWRQHRLQGKVDVIITDSPILLGLIYPTPDTPPSFAPFVLDTFAQYDNLVYFLERDALSHPYNPKGRSQTEEEAVEKDRDILEMLDIRGIDYKKVPIRKSLVTAQILFGYIQGHLNTR